jgi:demethylmenaquinone methyltransferase/2-methoxy-6-polyprenyl-1,4-benzoquinol methylase
MADLQGEAKRRYVADLFARIAPRYDVMNTMMTGGLHHSWRKLAVRMAARGLGGAALDVATGTGDLAIALASSPGIDGVVGLDLLPEMVERAQSKARSKGLASRVQFMVGDALSLPFPDDTFACATSAWGLRNMPDLRASLEEMARVVKPGGMVVSLESMPVAGGPARLLLRLFLHRIVPLMGQLLAGDRAAYTYLPQSVDRFLTPEAMARLFEEVSLREVGYRQMGMGAVAIHWGRKG